MGMYKSHNDLREGKSEKSARKGRPWSSPGDSSVVCPNCKCALPASVEQAQRLAEGETAWLFCPQCRQIVSGRLLSV